MAAPPAFRVGRVARPAPSHHKGRSATRAQKTSPWPRPASTATGSGLVPHPLERAPCKCTLRSQNRNTETIGPAEQEGLDQRKRKPERREEREQHAHRREHPLDPVRGIRDSILQRDLVAPKWDLR